MTRASAARAKARRSTPGWTPALVVGAAGTRHLGRVAPGQVTGSNLSCVRDHNQLLVLHMIRTRGPLTRRDVSRSTGLTFQTIENISRRLIEAGILEDIPPRAGINRARQLALRPAGAHALGIEVTPEGFRVTLCDLAGRTVAEQQRPALRSESILDELTLTVQDLIDDAEVLITTVLATGLTVHGWLPDTVAGHGRRHDHAVVSRERMCTELQRRLQIPVLYTTEIIAAARAEQWAARVSSQDFIYLHLASKIGCAVVSHGQLCIGARGRGGDIAHTRAVNNGDLCECGRRGCLQTLVAERGLRRAISQVLDHGEPLTLEQIPSLASSNQRVASVLECVASHVADALLPAVHLLDPETILIGGPVAEAVGAPFHDALERCVASACVGAPGPTVQRAQRGAGSATSAAQYVLYETFTPAMDHLVIETASAQMADGHVPAGGVSPGSVRRA
jgi:predicted NBD/HSP70 family sugar kinase